MDVNCTDISTIAIVGATIIGAAFLPAIGMTAGALVPAAMSTFGTIVPGVGTMHVSLANGGLAAILQHTSEVFVSVKASASGAFVGASTARFLCSKDKTGDKGQMSIVTPGTSLGDL